MTDEEKEVIDRWLEQVKYHFDELQNGYSDITIWEKDRTLFEKIMEVYAAQQSVKLPTIGEVRTYFINHHDCYTYYEDATGTEHSAPAFSVDAVLKMIEWLRNQITER